MRYAQILNGRAHWVFESDEKPEFAPNIVLVEAGADVEEGWTWDGENFLPPQCPDPLVPTLAETKAAKLAELAEARWGAETGGLTLPDGTRIKTDRESQALLTGAALSAKIDQETPIEWKGANGWVVLTPQEVLQVAGLVRQHVQACFSRERALAGLVDEATTIEEVLAVEW